MKQYQIDLTDNQWQFIKNMIEDDRKRKYNLRGVIDAILYISKSGCQCVIDSQLVKGCNLCKGEVGYDGGKESKRRKRHIVVDTLGLLLVVVVHSDTAHDSKGAKKVFQH